MPDQRMRRKAPEARRRPILKMPAEADPLGKTYQALPKVFCKNIAPGVKLSRTLFIVGLKCNQIKSPL
jgi:hypothetical protein